MSYLPRALEPALRRAARAFPAVVLTGPRQSGKTTTLRRLFGGSHRYLSLETPDVRASALADPRGFLAAHGPPLILDEIPYAPGLLPYLKEAIDADRRPGRFLLTGSQSFALMQGVTESLAGRAAILRLPPLALREIARDPGRGLPWERRVARARPLALWRALLRGAYPEVAAHPRRDAALWLASYLQTYLERDVRSLRQVGDLGQFQLFLRALAARSGQLLNLADLGRDLGVALNTAKAWLSVLEASDQVLVLRPYFANVGKRLVKTPKVYLTDTGLLCYLTGLQAEEHLRRGPLAGPVFECAVVLEVRKTLLARGLEPRLYFWRTSDGHEVDLIVDTGTRLVAVEAKATATPLPAHADSIARFRALFPNLAAPGWVVHGGSTEGPLSPHARGVPLALL